MSVQFGRLNFDGRPADREYLAKAEGMLAPYGPDGEGTYIKDSVGILFRAFHTTRESWAGTQPCITPSERVLTWDGRLDNRAELIRELKEVITGSPTDVAIVAAAYETWGTACFAKLVGDWALSVWDPRNLSLILAKDPIGTRHLYYSFDKEQVTWSTILDPLVLLAGRGFALDEEYIAGWLSFFPAAHLTPYVGIQSVPPSCLVQLQPGRETFSKYWDFDPSKRIRYRADGKYEEHFHCIFEESVRRRLRADRPVLSELSGGMDSSAIVCVADALLTQGTAETSRLDTISYYDDSEPNWNERPYFTKVEEKRGRTGCHINADSQGIFKLEAGTDRFAATPAAIGRPMELGKQFASCLNSQANRVILSGIGGDEVTGGVPTPTPELADYIARCRFKMLAQQLIAWALHQRKPWIHLLFEAVRRFLPPTPVSLPNNRRPPHWLEPSFVKRNRPALMGYETRVKLFGPRPSFQESLSTLDHLRRQLECSSLPLDPVYEKRYPFLDRDLLEFLFALPREQLVRPGHRRSLVRRALAGIIPDEILNRKRKAFVARAPVVSMARELPSLTVILERVADRSLGIINPAILAETLQQVCRGEDIPTIPLLRGLALGLWLRNIKERGVWNGRGPAIVRKESSPSVTRAPSESAGEEFS